MSFLSLLQGGRSVSTGIGVSASGGGLPNEKGSWTQVIASTPYDANWIMIEFSSTNGAWQFLVDIGYGAGGSESVLISNLHFSNGSRIVSTVSIPIHIPKGTRLSARTQSSGGSQACQVNIMLMSTPLAMGTPLSRITTLGADTGDSGALAVDPGATINTKGAWVQFSASLTHPVRAIWMVIGRRGNSALDVAEFLYDIGIGSGGSESVAIGDIRAVSNASIVPGAIGPLWTNIPAGTRLTVRALSEINDAADRVMDVELLVAV